MADNNVLLVDIDDQPKDAGHGVVYEILEPTKIHQGSPVVADNHNESIYAVPDIAGKRIQNTTSSPYYHTLCADITDCETDGNIESDRSRLATIIRTNEENIEEFKWTQNAQYE
ncbi:uncharacterized protein LOC144358068, partial [Saccoglossus kowalevskii]